MASRIWNPHGDRAPFGKRSHRCNLDPLIWHPFSAEETLQIRGLPMDPSSLPVAAAVASLAPLQLSKLSGGLSDQLSGERTTSRHTTQQRFIRVHLLYQLMMSVLATPCHVVTQRKRPRSDYALRPLLIGSGGRDRTYDLFPRRPRTIRVPWPTEQFSRACVFSLFSGMFSA